MEEPHHTKRTRQACEPCRRKKSRCPGEKPECSYCQRLGQPCIYKTTSSVSGSDPADPQTRHNRKMEHRLGNLEGQMNRLIQQLSPENLNLRRASAASEQLPSPQNSRLSDTGPVREIDPTVSAVGEPLADDQLDEIGRTYLTWCHGQPISLFDEASFLRSLKARDPELICALRALVHRFPPRTLDDHTKEMLEISSRRARKAVMDRIADGEVQLSTLQSLCILSICNFTSGKVTQAGLNIAMADHIKDTILLIGANDQDNERNKCFRSISVLKKLQNSVLPPMKTMMPSSLYPVGYSSLQSDGGDLIERPPQAQKEDSIPFYAEKICDVWQMARAYAASQVRPNAPPPWDSRSDFSNVMSRHLELDCVIPVKYRFRLNNMAEYDSETLAQYRGYWASFLFIQFVYSAIPCLLNHPFLLSMRLRHFRHAIPESFIQQSYEQVTRFMGWIIYFLDLLEKKSFQVSDPTLAHCVAIVSTIHLQHSFVKDPVLKRKASRGFDKCLRFLERMGHMWPSVAVMVENLRTLQGSVVPVIPQDGSQDTSLPSDDPSISINARLLWDILIYDRAGQVNARADESFLGSSLISKAPEKAAERQEGDAGFDLIGSAELPSHKSMLDQGPVYPPDDDNPESTENESNVASQVIPDMPITIGDVYLEGIGGYGDEDSMFLQANDYGRAIGDWFDFNAV